MKIVVFLVGIVLFFGCADRSAFSKFDIKPDEETAFDNVVYGKLTKDSTVYAVASALHLNSIYPQRFGTVEAFYIVVFAKDKQLLENINLTLNSQKVFQLEKLPPQNEYTHLLNYENKWSSYYLAKFPHQKQRKLSLGIALSNGANTTLAFQKNLR